MQYIDMHCDSLMMLMFRDPEKADLFDSSVTSVDFKRMQKGQAAAQFFAAFIPPAPVWGMFGLEPVDNDTYIETLRKYLLDNVEKHSDIIAMAYNAADIDKNLAEGKMSAVLTMEDGVAVDGSMDKLKRYYDMGYRALSLTWNAENCFGAPNSTDPEIMKKGLTAFGKEAVVYMQELGMLVDVSHLSDGGFYDVAELCKKPFVATHSNSRLLCPHQRNLTDDMIRVLGNAGGVSGINFGPEFLNEDITCKDSTVSLMAKHARHMADIGGVDCVALGTDLDGIMGNLEIADSSAMGLLESALEKEGFSADDIEKIYYKNVLRVMRESMK